jgi:AcrR family transcriptional regulator
LKVSAPAAYHHFKSLDEIAIALVEQGAKEMALCLDTAAGDERSLARSGEAYVKFALANPALYRLMFGDSLDEDARRSPAIVDLRNMADRIIRSRLEGHVEPAELAHASLYLWSLVHGLALLMIDRQLDAKSIEDVIRGVLKFAGRGLPPLPPVR